jgi:hypothetical protein
MIAFFLLVLISVVASAWLVTNRLRNREKPPVLVPLDDAPPGVLDAIVARMQQRPDAV